MFQRPRLRMLLILITWLTMDLFTVASARAGTESDIPGIPLPGPVATGQLGGAIYDVVYRFDVLAGYVLLVDLSGSTGTDFDLYVFDSSATTVIETRGLVARSTGPTSSESLSMVLRTAGTYYLDLNGATDVMGSYRLTVQFVPDLTRPTATVQLLGGKLATRDSTVAVHLDAFDDLSGISDMAFSEDGTNFYPWQPYRADTTWTFSPGDGRHTLWAKVRNGAGLESKSTWDSIAIDNQPPGILSVNPAQNSIVVDLRPTISVRFTEPIAVASWSQAGIVVQAPSGPIVPGATSYDPITSTGTFMPDTPLSPGLAYIITVGQVTDLAGNALPVLGSWTIKRILPASVTVTATPPVAVFGSPVRLAGVAALPAGEALALDAREGGAAAYAPVRSVVPSAGRYGLTLTPAKNTWYRVSYAGSATSQAASVSVRVAVRRKVSLLGAGSTTTRTAVAGRPVVLTAEVGPAGVAAVSFRLYRYDTARGRYVYVRSFGRTSDLLGRARLTWTPSAGRFAWRVAVASSVDYANNVTPMYRWSVSR